ncbi:eukaryotic translation elongation factor 1 epsilon-1-like [Apostichopus japonicus]|uniref:eukaryotic translation elongation factor 1 epsilon-1-like n=1 Tax=Stichopus japonicus TaxID=307972 RepID=UPI003AB5FB21
MAPNRIDNDVKALARYFNLKNCKCKFDKKSGVTQLVHNGQTVCGLASIASFLVQNSEQPSLHGGSCHMTKAQIQQWLQYRVTIVDRCLNEKDVTTVLKELNSFLESRVYFVTSSLTVADLVLYFGLFATFNQLTLQEKEKYLHLSRWFNNVQRVAKLEEFYPILPFSLNYLYEGVSEH